MGWGSLTQSKNTSSSNLRKGVSLRFVLVVPFMLQIFAAVGLTGYLAHRNGEKAIYDLETQLEVNVNARITQHLDNYLENPVQLTQTYLDQVDLNLLHLQDLQETGKFFSKQLQIHPEIGYIGYALTSGRYAGAGRWLDRQGITIDELSSQTKWKLNSFKSDGQGNRKQRVLVDDYAPLKEDWYTEAVKAGRLGWTKITPEIGAQPYISASANAPIYDQSHRLIGVIGVDLLLSQIQDFLRSLKISASGKVFIIERSGLLVADSSPEVPFKVHDQAVQRLSVLQSNDPLIRKTAAALKKRFGDFGQIQSAQSLNLKVNQAKQFIKVTPWRDQYGLDWLVVMIVPESDFMAQIQANSRTTLLLCIAALMVAVWLGLRTSEWIAQPILRLRKASQDIAAGDLEQIVETKGINELGHLAQSFNQMAEQLRQSFEALAQTNQALEDTNTVLETRVEERTAQLLSAKDAADVANRAKSEFLANMSHELRTPLNAILGFTQVMNRDSTLNPDQQENLGIIGRSGDHLLALINDVLDMSKIEAGCITVNHSVFDLYILLNSITDMLRLKAEAKGLALLCQWTSEVPQYIQSDQKKLRQVLLNLLGNAVKFTKTGSITLRVQKGSSDVKAQLASPSDVSTAIALHFTVKDTGAGIAEHELNTLFDPFVQTETGRKSEQGTGLGLAISQKFVQLLGGNIQVHSQLAQGTTFEFEIQAEVRTPDRITTALKPRRVMALEPGQPSYRILVSDDRWENRQLLIKLLTPIGFEVQEASNGQEAIAQWETWKPHLIWMDMRMPIMNGYETTRHIKAHLQGQATIIIALTASTLDEERAIVLSAGCEDFVRKPFLENEIFDKMAQYLGVRYIYADLATGELAKPSLGKLDAAALSTMPKEWLNQFSYASAQLDPQMLMQLLTQIPNQQAALKRSLQTHMDDFDFELLMTLAQEAAAL
jgi:signal transduction histidine kinase/CheY-like chemotaxis protein